MSSLWRLSIIDELQEGFQPRAAKLSLKGLILDEVKLTCQILEKEDFAMDSFSAEKDPDDHSVEILCLDILEKRVYSRYEDSLLALSLTMVAGMQCKLARGVESSLLLQVTLASVL